MRKTLLSLLAATSLTGVAHAGDLPSSKAPPAAPVIDSSWTGWYGGVQGGGAFGNTQFEQPNIAYSSKWKNNGVIGGVHFGYNYQIQQFLIGVQADGDVLSVAGTGGGGNPAFTNSNVTSHHDWLASIGGRLGYIYKNNILLYAIGGYSAIDAQSATYSAGVQNGQISTSYNGYNVGGGVEYAFTRNWSANLEYRYYDFSKFNALYTGKTVAFSEQTKFAVARIGVSYHWNVETPAAVVAKY
jgi:outer membrane immunogenic protein